jgi:hypothetical protein
VQPQHDLHDFRLEPCTGQDGSTRKCDSILQRCSNGGNGATCCGILSSYPFPCTKQGCSTCCNLFGDSDPGLPPKAGPCTILQRAPLGKQPSALQGCQSHLPGSTVEDAGTCWVRFRQCLDDAKQRHDDCLEQAEQTCDDRCGDIEDPDEQFVCYFLCGFGENLTCEQDYDHDKDKCFWDFLRCQLRTGSLEAPR